MALLFQLDITYEDGTAETVISDEGWKSATGPVLMSDIYNGEVYDARLEKSGWASPGYKDTGWVSVVEAAHDKNTLVASAGPPVRAIETIKPIQVLTTPKGETVFDMGQNMVGYIRLKVKGSAGSAITLKHAEVLDKDGNFYIDNLRAARQEVKYILKGSGTEIYEPHFTFQGFRYVAVEGLKDPPDPDMLTGVVIHSDMETTGAFKSSDSLINQLQHNIQWGQKGNFLDVPTDCPQRDERLGWTGDAQVFVHTAAFNMNVASFFTKWLKDLAADQHDNGVVPWVIPDVLGRGGSAGWADAATIVPWAAYLVYGDQRVLENQYESMKRWVAYMTEKAGESYLWNNGTHFGDWLFYSPDDDTSGKAAITDKHLIAQIFFANSVDITRKTARLLGKEQEAANYASLLKKVKDAFLNEYVTANGRLVSSTQTAYVLALQFDMLPQDQREAAAAKLVKNIQEYNYHLTTGFLGTPNLCHVLSRFGYHDVAYRLLTQETYPSWLYPVKKGATTIWERWDGIKPDGSFQNVGMNSFNHYAYGAIGDWMYRVMAGIDFDPDQPGYKHFFIRPQPGDRFSSVRASYESMYGNILSDWTLEDEKFILKVEVPTNSQATVKLPFAVLEQVKENGKPLRSAKGITNSRQIESAVTLMAGSGQYVFEYPVMGRAE